jgi:glycosyltransferase involved in cell wall biosynthesis
MKEETNYYKNSVRSYYDSFSRHLLKDYVYGNKRIEFAIRHALSWIPPNATKILDIGCGIGWSTWTFKSHLKKSHLVGVDLGQDSILIAKKLFQEEMLQYFCMDVLDENTFTKGEFDAIILLDVYEHFRSSDRSHIHKILDRYLSKYGVLFLSYPSVNSFVYDYSKRPEHLQPVDEFVTFNDIEQLANDVHGNIVFHKNVGIFKPDDYTYTTISRAQKINSLMPVPNKETCFEPLDRRHRNAQDRLNIRVTPKGTMLPMGVDPAICFLLSNYFTDQQILLRTFVEALPKPVRLIIGSSAQFLCDDGISLIPEYGPLKRIEHAFRRRTKDSLIDVSLIEAFEEFFQKNHINQIVTDTLKGASFALPLCRKMEIPLSVWFTEADNVIPDMSILVKNPKISKQIKAFFSSTKNLSQYLHEFGVPVDKIHHIPCGLDNSLIDFSRAVETLPVFVSIHDSLRTEEPEFVLIAFKDVLEKHPSARLVMVGSTYLSRRCARIASWMNMDHAIDFFGPLPDVDLAAILKHARAFICINQQPLLGAREPLLKGVMAGMFLGVPGIVSSSKRMKELIDENSGVFINVDSIDTLTRQIIYYINNPNIAREMGATARRIAVNNFSLDKKIEKFMSALQI